MMQSSVRAGSDAERIRIGSPAKEGRLGELLERSSSKRIFPAQPADDVEENGTDILLVLLFSIE